MHDIAQIQAAYDTIATDYDARWSVHVGEPQRRLTRDLQLRRGERCADLGCGTGVDTLEMLRLVAPGEVVAVDCSPAMLESASRRARDVGFVLETSCQGADEFIVDADAASFDAISLRFCLGYLAWPTTLPQLPRLLRSGGRVGILTILASSAPQAYQVYRDMSAELGVPDVPLTALSSLEQIGASLRAGGASLQAGWTHRFRLEFSSGIALADWLRTSGIATSAMLSELPLDVAEVLWTEFARRIEARSGEQRPALDFELAGIVATRANGKQAR